MALTVQQKVDFRRALERALIRNGLPIDFDKPTINLVVDNLDDWWQLTGKAAAGSAMGTSISAAQKAIVGKIYFALISRL